MSHARIRKFVDVGDPGAPIGSPSWCRASHVNLQAMKRRTDHEVASLKYSLLEFKKYELFRQILDDSNKPFETWEDYVQYPEPNGLGMPVESARAVMEALDDRELLGRVLGKHGGAREGAGRPKAGEVREPENQADIIRLNKRKRQYGTSRQDTIDRLDRDGHAELAVKVRTGEISAAAAARQLGWRKEATPFERILKSLPKLTLAERARIVAEINRLQAEILP
jgi:hypothetical protein